jgi:hypothetical protein
MHLELEGKVKLILLLESGVFPKLCIGYPWRCNRDGATFNSSFLPLPPIASSLPIQLGRFFPFFFLLDKTKFEYDILSVLDHSHLGDW